MTPLPSLWKASGGSARLDMSSTQSTTELAGAGAALSGVYAITPHLQFAATGFFERAWIDVDVAGAAGSYDAARYGGVLKLSGTYRYRELTIQPDITALYAVMETSGYRDSASTYVAGQWSDVGNVNAGVALSTTLEGDGSIAFWQPYLSGRLFYDALSRKGI